MTGTIIFVVMVTLPIYVAFMFAARYLYARYVLKTKRVRYRFGAEDGISYKEIAIGGVFYSLVIGISLYGTMMGAGSDFMVLNGEVTGKYRDRVSCEHSYRCNCRQTCSGTGSSRSCSTTCDTCYEHSFDYDWVVKSNVGNILIDRVNRQGTKEPPRWTSVQNGEPFALSYSYFNYIKASPTSLFNNVDAENLPNIRYPTRIHDYYRVQRVIPYQSQFTPSPEFNERLNDGLKALHRSRVNINVIVHGKTSEITDDIMTKLIGGKINDVTVLIGVDRDGTIKSADAYSWSKNQMLTIAIRDGILDVGTFDSKLVSDVILTNIAKHYTPRDIEDFAYLEDSIELPKGVIIFVILFCVFGPFGIAFIATKLDY
tara:strand:+ start:2452 stop:3564 length:1113 start_codon:yes stop_codon:yes gene_type:complete